MSFFEKTKKKRQKFKPDCELLDVLALAFSSQCFALWAATIERRAIRILIIHVDGFTFVDFASGGSTSER